ncbi:unnamed protein product [Heterobilharzia americana]|nr:unnamed protein product [Heterobilharzia americana]
MDLWPNQKYIKQENEVNFPQCKRTNLFKPFLAINKTVSIHELMTFHRGLNLSSIQCSLFPIKRLNDYQSIYLNAVEQIYDGYQSEWPMFMVMCQPKENVFLLEPDTSWSNSRFDQSERLFVCGSYPPQIIDQTEPKWSSSLYRRNEFMFNVLLLGIDSISRLSAFRYFPKTVKFLQQINESATIMNIYNVIGDGTTVNLLGLLTGQLESELPESRKSHIGFNKGGKKSNGNDNHTVLDSYPWIWKEYSEYGGYATHYIEDTPKWGTFQHRLCGFGLLNSPTTSYGRPCLLAASQEESYSEKVLGCTMSRHTHQLLLESLTEFFTTYSDRPRFSLTFLSELIHENPAYGKLLDEDLVKLIKRIYHEDQLVNSEDQRYFIPSKHPFANTLVVLFSDHGPRMGDARLSVQGKLEERLPFMSIIAPKRLRQKLSTKWSHIQSNQNRLITLFDVHATLRDLLVSQLKWVNTDYSFKEIHRIQLNWKKNPSRGISLFNPIPIHRNCDDAYISSHWCVCLNWIPVTKDFSYSMFSSSFLSSNPVIKSTNAVIHKINEVIIRYKSHPTTNSRCSLLSLHQIKSVEQAILPRDVIRFIRSQDEDGRIPLFQRQQSSQWSLLQWFKQLNIFAINDNINRNDFIYDRILLRIHLVVKPEFANFEATVKVNVAGKNSFESFDVMDISRMDVYEKYNWCLSDNEWAELKQYCICENYT